MLHKAKTQYYTDIVNDSKDDPKKLWQTMKAILHWGHVSVLPEYKSSEALADKFAEYFRNKIAKIQAAFPSNACFPVEPGMTPCSYLDMFTAVCEDAVKKIILSSPTNSCSIDPWPTFFGQTILRHLDSSNHKNCIFVFINW